MKYIVVPANELGPTDVFNTIQDARIAAKALAADGVEIVLIFQGTERCFLETTIRTEPV